MGRYISAGIVCSLKVIVNDEWITERDVHKDKEKIIEMVGKHIDVTSYNIEEHDNAIVFNVKEEFVNCNIHSLLKEMNSLMDMKNHFLYSHYEELYNEIDVNNKSFNQKNYPLKLHYFTEKDNYKSEEEKKELEGKYCLITKDETSKLPITYFPCNEWILRDSEFSYRDYNIDTEYLMLWLDLNKVGEESFDILDLLTTFSHSYFKNPLAQNIHFYIEG